MEIEFLRIRTNHAFGSFFGYFFMKFFEILRIRITIQILHLMESHDFEEKYVKSGKGG